MEFCVIKIITQTATFRDPDFQNFHKTLFLPPPTTIIGFAGAALGLSPKKALEYFTEEPFLFGVYGKSGGKAKDLWKYRKKKSKSFVSDIITKEIIFFNEFYIVYGAENKKLITEIKDAFNFPYYALTLGNSDSLAKIKIIKEFHFDQSSIIENAILEDNVIDKVISNPDKSLEFSIYTTSDPIVYNLPVLFDYEKDYGVRNIKKRKLFSFIGTKMKLNYSVNGIFINHIFIPLFNIQ